MLGGTFFHKFCNLNCLSFENLYILIVNLQLVLNVNLVNLNIYLAMATDLIIYLAYSGMRTDQKVSSLIST